MSRRLHDLTLDMIDWMIAGEPDEAFGLRLPPGGVDAPEILRIVRAMTAGLLAAGVRGAWALEAEGEVVGLCSFRRPPVEGEVEIGYGMAPRRQGRGHATAAVEGLLAAARAAGLRAIVAETAAGNVASQRVLEKNGFARTGTRFDPEDGLMLSWRRELACALRDGAERTGSMTTESNVLAGLPPLISRELLFGNPENVAPRISPDGKKLAYLAPHEGMLGVWVRTIGESDDRVVAVDPERPIVMHTWRGDSEHILYLQDRGGNENHHLFQVDLEGGERRELTPGDNVKVDILDVDERFPNEVLIASNAREVSLFDVCRLDLETGASTLDTENPGDVSSWLSDNRFVVRAAVVHRPDGSSEIRVRDDASAPWRTLDTFSFEDGFATPVAFAPDDRSLYVVSAKDANASNLVRYDLATGRLERVVVDETYDVAGAYVDHASKKLVAAAIMRDRLEWTVLDPEFEADFAALRALHPGDLGFTGASADGNTIIVSYLSDTGPVAYYAYDRATRGETFLFYSRPALLERTLAPMEPVVIPARDGLSIHGYLTLPAGLEPKGLPAVLFVHGGPWYRDGWGYNPFVQWLANRGYVVLQVNFRGSTGYGKAFLNAGNREWAGTMRTDLLDARDWAIERGYADPKRFAIMGGSYGGYAVLAALTFTPDAFTCGIDLVGPSNLNTLLASIPPYWKTMRSIFERRMGDDEAFLNEQSPLFKAEAIVSPLLIAQGANDPRVKQQESDQIVEAMRKNGIEVTYVLFEDEGHGFVKPENNMRYTATAEAFLAKHLGGRAEPPRAGEEIEPYLR